jgi:membrane dipeptidase
MPNRIRPLLLIALAAPLACAQQPVVAQTPAPQRSASQAPAPSQADWDRARRVLRSTPLIDGHNDLPWEIRRDPRNPRDVDAYDLRQRTRGHTDIERLRRGMVGAQFWSIYIPGDVRDSGYARMQLEQFDIAHRIIRRYPEAFELAHTAADIRRIFRRGRIASLLGLEGGHVIENSLGALRTYYDLGARYMTLTHNVTLDWADAAADVARHNGLSPFGEEVVREMNRLGMLVDLSHVSPATMSDALNISAAPVIFSHSSARALTDVPRNVPDSILRRLPANGGVVMVTFVPDFISRPIMEHRARQTRELAALRERLAGDTAAIRRETTNWHTANPRPRSTLADVADHIEHVRRVAGIDHVGIGSDYDGIDDVPVGLEDVSTFPALFAELSRRGWSEADLRRLAGENMLRLMERAEAVSARLRSERPPSTMVLPGR